MAKLSGARLMVPAKVSKYLLNAAHPHGGPKARFFQRFGFDARAPEQLLRALDEHPDTNDIGSIAVGRAGIKSVVECRIATPDGRNPCVRTVWALEPGSTAHRFGTAYPVLPG